MNSPVYAMAAPSARAIATTESGGSSAVSEASETVGAVATVAVDVDVATGVDCGKSLRKQASMLRS